MQKLICNFVTIGGSGTHLLLDIMARMNIEHLPLGSLVEKIICSKNYNNVDETKIRDIQTYKKIMSSITHSDLNTDTVAISNIIADSYLRKVKERNYFIMQPELNFVRYDEEDWTIEDVGLYNIILRQSIEFADINYKKIFYIRNPADIFYSYERRFHKNEEDRQRSIYQLESFFSINKKEILTNSIRYEDLCNHPQETIKQIAGLFGISQNRVQDNLKSFIIFNTSMNYKINYSNETFKDILYMYAELNDIKNNFLENVLLSIKRYYNELRVIYQFAIKANYVNDAAFTRHRFSIPSRIIVRVLRLFLPYKMNIINGINIANRLGRKNIVTRF